MGSTARLDAEIRVLNEPALITGCFATPRKVVLAASHRDG
jgi:hypothetical protein